MRKKRAERRHVEPDPQFNDIIVSKFVNNIMQAGKKSTARRIMYDAFDVVGQRTGQNPVDVFRKALANVSPALEVKARRVGGATYQVPSEVREDRRVALAIRWLSNYASERRDKSAALRLAAEFIAAANGEGGAVKKKDDVHRMADANKAFAHFKW